MGSAVKGMGDGEVPFLWPCFSSWEYHPPSLPPQDHAETPATAVSEHQKKGDWSQENGEHCFVLGGFCAELEIGVTRQVRRHSKENDVGR